MDLLKDYIVSTSIISPEDLYDDVIKITFKNMGMSISKVVIKRKKELPKEDCLFVLSCKIYKLSEYMKAYPNPFKVFNP